jgi:hypothetical protein
MYTTTDLGKAAFLQMRGHQVRISVNGNGYWTFHFDALVSPDIQAFDTGAVVPARLYAKALSQLKRQASKARLNTREKESVCRANGHTASEFPRQTCGA